MVYDTAMRVVRARIWALLAALVLLLPVASAARAQFYCQMMGRVVPSCCCTKTARAPDRIATPVLQPADCCERLAPATCSAASAGLERGAADGLTQFAASALPTLFRTPLGMQAQRKSGQSCAESTQAPLAIGPPLFVEYCAFLS